MYRLSTIDPGAAIRNRSMHPLARSSPHGRRGIAAAIDGDRNGSTTRDAGAIEREFGVPGAAPSRDDFED